MRLRKVVRQVFWGIGFLILLAGFSGVTWAADQKTLEDTERSIKQQQEQLKAQREALEAQERQLKAQAEALEELKARVEGMAKEQAAAETPSETEKSVQDSKEELRIAKAHDDSAARNQKVRGIDLAKEEDRHTSKGTHFNIPNTGTVVTVSGYVKGSVIHDFDKIASPAKFITKDIVVNGQPPGEPSHRTTFTANASRFIIGSSTPTDIGKLTTLISMDFFGNSTDASPDPRLRQAWGQLDDFLAGGGLRAGQSWSTWDDVSALPETMDFEGPNGSQQTRQPLVRWTRDFQDTYTLWIAVEDPDYSIENGDNKTNWPDTIVSLNWHGGWGHLKPAFMGRVIKGDSVGGNTDTKFGWGAQLAGIINVPLLAEKDNFKFQVVYGGGISSYNNDGGFNDAVFDGNDLKAIYSFQGYGAFQHWWLESLRSNAVFGWVDVDNRSVQPGDALDRTLYVAVNLVWSPIKQMDIGGEYLWGQRKNKNDDDGEANRIQFSAKFNF